MTANDDEEQRLRALARCRRLLPYGFVPNGWLECDGQELSRSEEYRDLFWLFGARYGGDGVSTFALPRLAPVDVENGPPLIYSIRVPHFSAESPPMDPTAADPLELLGAIDLLPIGSVPPQWVVCDGQLLSITDNLSLFSVLHSRFGGDGVRNFALPRLAPFRGEEPQKCYCISLHGSFPARSAYDEESYIIVVSDEEQYSIWPVERSIPLGWRAEGTVGSKDTCLKHIAAAWTDMRPKSQR